MEIDSCGVAMVADIRGRRSHEIIGDRFAGAGEPRPHVFLREVVDFDLPPANLNGENTFAVGNCFLPAEPEARARAIARVEEIAAEENIAILGWREPLAPHPRDWTSTISCPPTRNAKATVPRPSRRRASTS